MRKDRGAISGSSTATTAAPARRTTPCKQRQPAVLQCCPSPRYAISSLGDAAWMAPMTRLVGIAVFFVASSSAAPLSPLSSTPSKPQHKKSQKPSLLSLPRFTASAAVDEKALQLRGGEAAPTETTPPHALPVDKFLASIDVSPEQGLSSMRAEQLLKIHGLNQLEVEGAEPLWALFSRSSTTGWCRSCWRRGALVRPRAARGRGERLGRARRHPRHPASECRCRNLAGELRPVGARRAPEAAARSRALPTRRRVAQ